MMLKVLDLFSGIGGFSLGLERTGGFKTVAFCEIEAYPRKVLAKHWPEVPCYHDIRELTAERLAADGIGVDVICGGFPCQDISVAGAGAGMAGERSGLWAEFARLIGELRPRYAIVENVSALLSRGLTDVLGDLAALGYDAEWHCIPAFAVGAPHRRDRIWIVAYSASGRCKGVHNGNAKPNDANPSSYVANAISGELRHESGRRNGASWAGEAQSSNNGEKGIMANATRQLLDWSGETGQRRGRQFANCDWWLSEPDVGRGSDGFPEWLERCVGRGLNYAESCRRTEVLRSLWSVHVSQALRQCAGGLDRFQQAQILFAFVREYESGSDEARLLVAGQEASEAFLRGLRECALTGSAPRRPRQDKQRGSEHPDTVQRLSRLLALDGEADWAGSGWEDATPRIAVNVPSRVDRLKGLGNAVVPQIPELIGRAILAAGT